jgi:hypothetical protein
MFDINYDGLNSARQDAVRTMNTEDCLFLQRRSVLLKSPLKLAGDEPHNAWRISHPKLKYIHVPYEFISVNNNSVGDKDYYQVTNQFRNLCVNEWEIGSLCCYYGRYRDGKSSNQKCKNHVHCIETHKTLRQDGFEKFIEDCNNLDREPVTTTATSTGVPTITSSMIFNTLLSSKSSHVINSRVKNVFWLDTVGSNQVKLFGNAILPQGSSSFPLHTNVRDQSFTLSLEQGTKLNRKFNKYYPEIISALISNNRVYFETYEQVQVYHKEPVASVQMPVNQKMLIEVEPLPELNLVTFSIDNFKNSNWPVRSITDKICCFFAQIYGCAVELHWKYNCPLTKKIYDKLYSEAGIDTKENFIARLELRNSLDEKVDEWTIDQAKQVLFNLQHNRSFHFLIPNKYDIQALNNKITLLLQSLKHHRTLTYKFHLVPFKHQDFPEVQSIQNFFSTEEKLENNHYSLILMKPNFQHLKFYELWEKIIAPYANIVDFKVIPKITEEQFSGLYSGCSTRPYGPAWREYLDSDVVVALCMNSKNIGILRSKCVQLREQSQVTWIKNIVHCSANVEECYRDLKIFFKNEWEFTKPSFLKNDFFADWNGEKLALEEIELDKEAVKFKKPAEPTKRKSSDSNGNPSSKKKVAIKFKMPNDISDYNNPEQELSEEIFSSSSSDQEEQID